ncbi:MAG: UDP-N-acetylmuramoylalanine--D-glutamate ligase [Frankiales bacterium]|jgi:UDP-N-acetylmuramoylalanine--D-glutamate ligase|nr:UDP-N-acetylmuramoylalanine--D-glutamate ligase [Frankiales bacterium]
MDWHGLPVTVAGAGVSGTAAARVLQDLGARVTVVDDSVTELDGFAVQRTLPDELALVVTSPGFRPTVPMLVEAASRGVEVIGEVELAWRLRKPSAAPWLALTGTNGKTTTVKMLEAMLTAAGHRAVAAGNVGLPLLEAVLDDYDVLAVELSSFQLHWSSTVRPHTGTILNLADDHTDWHGSFREYVLAKARIFDADVAIGNGDSQDVQVLLDGARGRRVSFTLRAPRPGEVGVVEEFLVDRAFPDVPGEATELATLADIGVPGAHNVANALAAAAMARSFGVPATAVRDGLLAFVPEAHRNALVVETDGISWVDDSKATNPHAAAASLAAYPSVVWVAGGLLKGADVDDLVRDAAPRLRAVVLLGTDRAVLREALRRHAPDVPVVEVSRLDTEAMQEVVAAARSLARPGDTVLLAPAAASMDCFLDYKQRGDLFARWARA